MKKGKSLKKIAKIYLLIAVFVPFVYFTLAYTGQLISDRRNTGRSIAENKFSLNTKELDLVLAGDKAIGTVFADVQEETTVYWTISDSTIASLNWVTGFYTVVTGKKEGVTTLTAIIVNDERSFPLECTVRVRSVDTLSEDVNETSYGCNAGPVFSVLIFLLPIVICFLK